MILFLADKCRKQIGWLLTSVFYMQVVLPVKLSATQTEVPAFNLRLPLRNVKTGFNTYMPVTASFIDSRNAMEKKESIFDQQVSERKEATRQIKTIFSSGPGQPEMASFQSVNANNMVDLFTGDFSYNIPLMDVGGYPVNIHYSSGVTMDQEASWVGLGWNINPGTVTRNMRGLPDDFNKNDSITKIQSIKVNKTVGVKLGGQAELTGFPLTIGAGYGVFHNNYNGWGIEQNLNASVTLSSKSKGQLNSSDDSSGHIPSLKAGIGLNNNSQTGLTVSPSLNVSVKKIEKTQLTKESNFGISTNYNTRSGLSALTIDATNQKYQGDKFKPNPEWGAMDVNISFAQPAITPTISMPTTSSNFIFHAKTGGELWALHPNVYVEGYVNKQEIKQADKTQKLPAYGYLYFTDANNNQKALLDFNREKELQFNYQTTPHIAIPQYTYDIYSINGEGIGGTIRPYRGDVGFSRDHYLVTKSSNDQFSAELGFGNIFHGGLSYDYVRSYTANNGWTTSNQLIKNLLFQSQDSTYQPVYFRNPAEKTSNSPDYYQQVGNEDLIRVKLDRSSLSNVSASSSFIRYRNGVTPNGNLPISSPVIKKDRDKRSQVVTYLNSNEATLFGLDRNIYSYKENTIPVGACMDTIETIQRTDGVIRKANHISEIDVLNNDGRRYVYGIPAYNVEEQDVTFSVDKEQDQSRIDKGYVSYMTGTDNTPNNNKGKENYFNKEIIPAYAHSFLLTGILSPDYVDIKGDGITDDDLGDAVKFNYTRVYGGNNGYYEWRTPGESGIATYNEGLKTYNRDDKASYLYGKKEVWYVHSVESKTMIALFKISATRKDAFSVYGEDGGFNLSRGLRRLDRIELYSKADLLRNGVNAKPVKTVHFEYTYELTPNYAGNSGVVENATVNGQQVNVNQAKGKLTLKRIWFSYNGNEKGKQNPYVFTYNGVNPDYHQKKYDRWGNYKDQSSNPGGLNNADFPYSVQDSAMAAQNAGAWHLTDIKLPSGGRMKVTYESDDYAYVQNKRAEEMFTIAGFGQSPQDNLVSHLYDDKDNEFVFINSAVPLSNPADVYRTYLEGNDWLYLKIAVIMPADKWGSGYEFVPVYGKVESYGLVDQNRFWVKFEKVQGYSPMVRAALQFLRNNLPSKAYPSSELGDNVDLGAAVKMLLSSITEIKNAVSGFEKNAKTKGWCKSVEIDKSFIRLNAPDYKKLGGGIRVKQIEIFDNWNAMTNQKESIYGQEYSYRTSIDINGQKKTISSGVATYEPMIGNEENPFRQPIAYSEKIAPLAPVISLYSEMPLGESYFPGASVGYSQVRVRTINTKAKSANGWSETEYFTSKDFPTIVENTLLDQDAKTRYKPKLLNLLKIYSVDRITTSQGFKVELNDMNGKVKATASYAENDSLNPIAYTRNYYKTENDVAAKQKLSNTVWVVDSANGKINKSGTVGEDIELVTDFRQQYSLSTSGGVSPNLDFFRIGIFPIPIPSLFKFPSYDENMFRSAATVKIIQRYGILDSVVVMDKGSVVSTKNLLYDGQSGEVLLSRTKNEFNDPIYNFSYPAHWTYSGMGMAYKNIHAVWNKIKVINGKMYNPTTNLPYGGVKSMESGDELWVAGFKQSAFTGNDCLNLNPLSTIPFLDKLWVIDAAKGVDATKPSGLSTGLYLIDKEGIPFSGYIVSSKVIRSGKRNMLDASVGSIMSLENPVREVSPGNFKLTIDSLTKVINTAASTYKDLWKVDNSLYQADSCYTKIDTITKPYMYPVSSVLMRQYVYRANTQAVFPTPNIINSINYTASIKNIHLSGQGGKSRTYRSKAVINFDFSGIPTDATVLNATVNLYARSPKEVWDGYSDGDKENWSGYIYAHYNNGADVSKTNAGYLSRLTVPVNTNTNYNNVVTSSDKVFIPSAPDQSCEDRLNLNATQLIQNIVKTPQNNYGLLFTLADPNNGSSNSSLRILSFCTGVYGQSAPAPLASPSELQAAPALPYGCTSCIQPILSLTYSFQKDTCVKVCRKNINDTATNPYRWGILGNWRMDKAYTYFSDRTESDASISTSDIRREGVLKAFTPYWKFTDSVLLANADTSKWVWNSAMSKYNRKGFEVENYDPLGRYNSGLYGYNQTLPVSIMQNGKYRENLFDGFEDYLYKTNGCTVCETPREFDFINSQAGVSLNNIENHTGKYSVKVNAGATSLLTVPVVNPGDTGVSLNMQVDSTPVYSYNVVGKGTGLTGAYSGFSTNIYGVCNNISFLGPVSRFSTSRIDPLINFSWGNLPPVTGMCLPKTGVQYNVNWSGKLQAKYTGFYRFYLNYSGIASLSVTRGNKTVSFSSNGVKKSQTDTLYLQAGELYNVAITYSKASSFNAGSAALSWSVDQVQSEQIIPQNYLYPANMVAADTLGSVVRNILYYCIKMNNVKPLKAIRSAFSPYQGSKMVISAWVKMEGADCNTAPALTDVIQASFNAPGNSTIISLLKTGVRIEGWQRYESVVDIPSNAVQLFVSLKGQSGKNIYVDDIRIQPYNSNVKNYVYDPVSLRLMAELDENNYATFYEYDDDGTLIRVKKETERGIMTIKETRSALLKDNQ